MQVILVLDSFSPSTSLATSFVVLGMIGYLRHMGCDRSICVLAGVQAQVAGTAAEETSKLAAAVGVTRFPAGCLPQVSDADQTSKRLLRKLCLECAGAVLSAAMAQRRWWSLLHLYPLSHHHQAECRSGGY